MILRWTPGNGAAPRCVLSVGAGIGHSGPRLVVEIETIERHLARAGRAEATHSRSRGRTSHNQDRCLVKVSLIEIDQEVAVALGAGRRSGRRSMKARRCSGSARPSSFLAFFHDSARRCRAARMVSRQTLRPKRSRTNATRRLRVKRGGGSAPSTGGAAAAPWAARTTSPRLAAVRAQRGDGRRCGHRPGPRGPVRDRHAASPSRSADGARCAPPPGWPASLSHVVEGERALAGARMRCVQRQPPQVIRCLTPACHNQPVA